MSAKHTLSVLVENKPGVLVRIAGLFSRRGFNIDSLAVGETEHPEISRITIVVEVSGLPLELDPAGSVQRELVLVKVATGAETRSQVLEVVQMFRAKVVDVAPDAVTIEA